MEERNLNTLHFDRLQDEDKQNPLQMIRTEALREKEIQ
jgi:hypothetical protein